ncbi:MAG: peptidase M3 [Halobacteriovorax sp.]|nr:peptidase M3 [Halobacteriovorax sp.]
MSNPIIEKSKLPHGAIAFDQIKVSEFIPSLDKAVEIAKERLSLIKNEAKPTFENIIERMEFVDSELNQVASIFYNLHSAEKTAEIQAIAEEFSKKITNYSNDVSLDRELFSQVEKIWKSKDQYTGEDRMLLEKTYKGFVRGGANLSDSDKDKLRAIDTQLADKKIKFSDNLLKATNDFFLQTESESDLEGLPESVREAAAEEASSRKLKGWVFTLHYPSFMPFMTYSSKRDLRKKMFMAFSTRAYGGNFDNTSLAKSIAKLSFDRAVLLGYKDHAEYVLEERMAQKTNKVTSFMQELLSKAAPAAKNEMKDMQEWVSSKGGPNPIESWDYAYWADKLKKERFNVDDEQLRPYFKLENVIDGVFGVAEKLYGLKFKLNSQIPVYHKDVRPYEVHDEDGSFIGLFYADFFPRATKSGGAWANDIRAQWLEKGVDIRPHAAIVCNFTKPTATKPSLLGLDEVLTLFHEFGHALHVLLSKVKYRSLSCTSVYWDFVELPSQIFENWVYEKECLDLFAKHYETGETIPAELVANVKRAASFHEGRSTLRQLAFGLLDMGWFSGDPSHIQDIEKFEQEVTEPARLTPKIEGVCSSTAFSHIFDGGYSSGYYSYKWAEVLDADAFAYFQEKGVFNREVAKKFRTQILEKGGSAHPMELYKAFRGQEPSVEPLLERAGLV